MTSPRLLNWPSQSPATRMLPYVARTQFSNYGLVGSNQRHAIYVYRPVVLTVDHCFFAGGLGDGFDIPIYSANGPWKGLAHRAE